MILGAPYFEKHGKNPKLSAFVSGVTASATGAITGAIYVLGKRSIIDFPTIALAVVAFLVVFKTKFPEPVLIVLAGLAGLVIRHLHPGG